MKFLTWPVHFLLLLSMVLTAGIATAARPDEALKTLLSSNSIDPDQVSLYVWDLEGDYKVASHREGFPVVPASVMKCVTTAALSRVMPYKSTIKTKVTLEGKQTGNAFIGKIIVTGAGDPSLGDGRFQNQENFPQAIAKAIKNKGITSFEGFIQIDDSYFAGPATHPSWGSGDLSQSYGTGCHAFNYEGNASGKAAVKDPGAVFKRQLPEAMRNQGITYTENGNAPTAGKKINLLTYNSPSVGNLMRSCMFRSDNLYAETFLRLFGRQNGTDGSVKASAKVAMQHWDALNFNTDAIEIVDGSGLSRDNRLSAEFLGSVLKEYSRDPDYVSFFPLVGEEGTVRGFLKDTPLQGYMALKTGSMNGIQSYAGYVLDEEFEPTHVVVVMVNGLKNRSEYRAALEKFFLSLFN